MRILIVHDGFFPYGTAFAVRLVNFCRLFDSLGFKTHVIASYSKDTNVECNKIYDFENVTFQITDGNKAKSIDSFIGPKNFWKEIEGFLEKNSVSAVFTSRGVSYVDRLIKKCGLKSIPCIVEQCEWLDISSYKFGYFDYRYLKTKYLFWKGYKKADGIIAISRLLETHFKKRNIPTIRIPVIADVKNVSYCLNTDSEKLRIIFTGNLGQRKELLKPIISVLANDPFLKSNIEFHIYGPSKVQVVDNVGSAELIDKVGECLTIHGYVAQEEMHEIQEKADFQYFIRPQRKSSHAGFPTKLVESLAAGTPVITNNTGDIPLCIENGVNGYIVGDDSQGELSKILYEILSQTAKKRKIMRINARKTAEEKFDYRIYKEEVNDFISHFIKEG